MSSVSKVVAGGFCVGCGACSVATQGRVPIAVNRFGATEANLVDVTAADLDLASTVCPFADEVENETTLSERIFPGIQARDPKIGKFVSVTAGRVRDLDAIRASSSGGLTSWITIELLKRGLVDGVIHVSRPLSGDRLFAYSVSITEEELREHRKSQYYSTDFAAVLLSLRGDGRRYAFVGVPCYVKALRLIAERDPVLKTQICFYIALVCGHMKTSGFAELLAWQLGVSPSELGNVDFRWKVENRPTPEYEFSAWSTHSPERHSRVARELLGGNWGHAMFQLKACDFCDDIFGEVADVCFGDAWLPEYTNDWRGTNVVINRNPQIEMLLREGVERGDISLEDIPIVKAVQSQEGNFRHRRDGLSVRLSDARRRGEWVPTKRVAPGSLPVGLLRRRIVRLRQRMGELSHQAFLDAKAAQSLALFQRQMSPLMSAMDRAYLLLKWSDYRRLVRSLIRKIDRWRHLVAVAK